MDEIIAAALQHKVEAVVIAGDIFDSADTTAAERDMLMRKAMVIDAICHLLIIPGNHDLENMHVTTLHYLAMLTQSGKFKRTTVVEKTSLVMIGDTLFILLVAHGHEFRSELKIILKEIREASLRLDHKHIVVVTHQTVKGSLTGTGFRLPKGVEIKPIEEVTYYALGDIHVRQSVGSAAFYPGSPIQTAFDEDGTKGVLIVDTNSPKKPEFHAINSRKYVVVKSSDTKKLRKLAGTDAHVKVILDKTTKRGREDSDLDAENIVKTEHAKSTIDTSDLKSGGKIRDDLKTLMRRKHGLTKKETRLGLLMLDEPEDNTETP